MDVSIQQRKVDDNLIASENPTTCPYDGARTEWLGSGKDDTNQPYQIEECLECKRLYHVYDQ